RKRIQREEILRGALELLRKSGLEAWNARALAAHLGISTQPLFSAFSGMEELKEAALEEVAAEYRRFTEARLAEGRYPKYKALGMAYVEFAREEPRLFALLFMNGSSDRMRRDWDGAVMRIEEDYKLSEEKAERIHLEMWICVHGIATMLATGTLSLSEEEVSRILTDVFVGLKGGEKK
ncbi:MAG: WHG domain-containing protein, partial [Clostridia bacterium]|nr:WHG domain-containing protein [Clostridia bacterium]